MLRFLFPLYFSPEDTGTGGPTEIQHITADDLADDLPTIDVEDEEDKETDKEDKEEKEDDEKEDKESEEEEEEEPEQLDTETIAAPPKRKEILAKYPDIFKTFPYLQTALYGYQAHVEVFPSVEEAKEAQSKAEALDGFEQELLKGSTEKILVSLKEQDKNAFYKLVDDYLPTLQKVDKDAFTHVMSNAYKTLIAAAVTTANKKSNDALKAAAEVMHTFIFGDTEFSPPSRLSTADTNDNKAEDEQQLYLRERFEDARNDISQRVDNTLKAFIDKNIDPKGNLPSYVRKAAAKDALDRIYSSMRKDAAFGKVLTRLWTDSSKTRYNRTSTDKIRATYISKANTLMPNIIKAVRNEAFKGISRRSSEERSETRETVQSGKPVTKVSNSGKTPRDRAKNIPEGMSTSEFLMSDD